VTSVVVLIRPCDSAVKNNLWAQQPLLNLIRDGREALFRRHRSIRRNVISPSHASVAGLTRI
jgi:hypothetical protein